MTRFNYIFIFFTLSLLLLSCEKKKVSPQIKYKDKANELIRQVLIDYKSCDCILEIPNKSSLQIYKEETPAQYKMIRERYKYYLELKDKIIIDSLDRLSTNYKFDAKLLKDLNIKLVPRRLLKLGPARIYKMCPKEVLSIYKPIFSKDYKTAILATGVPFACSHNIPIRYKYKNGKWVESMPVH